MRSVAQETYLDCSLEKALADDNHRMLLFKLQIKVVELTEKLTSNIFNNFKNLVNFHIEENFNKVKSIVFAFRNKTESEIGFSLLKRHFENLGCYEEDLRPNMEISFVHKIKIDKSCKILSPTFLVNDFFCKENRNINDNVEYFIVQ
jgi:hypothetical protein